ncbi:ferredoxin family protein [Neorickettsia findlayensis]|uniref:Ferredoxin n=1 Tax=Neorickettsia findlayensis TaxID=2686014 RepID=A0A6P1G9X6_9RICK|nr:ferredoxin family protein [Neorickettsia findlayensis]QHD65100.1 DUF3470 domain-containing protein [Neorickettsia findlayensis]
MPHVVTEKCLKCKYTDCVEVCPVDCFREAGEYLVIDPDVCIDCGVCVPECPIEAIINDETYIDGRSLGEITSVSEASLLTKKQLDARFMVVFNRVRAAELPSIMTKKEPLDGAEKWAEVPNKICYIKQTGSKENGIENS